MVVTFSRVEFVPKNHCICTNINCCSRCDKFDRSGIKWTWKLASKAGSRKKLPKCVFFGTSCSVFWSQREQQKNCEAKKIIIHLKLSTASPSCTSHVAVFTYDNMHIIIHVCGCARVRGIVDVYLDRSQTILSLHPPQVYKHRNIYEAK